MPALVITSLVSSFTVVGNDYSQAIGTPCITLGKSDIRKIYISKDETFLVVEINNTKDFMIDLVGVLGGSPNKLAVKVDSINLVAPTSIQHLHDLFKNLKN